MEENDVTSTQIPHTPTSVVRGEVVFPPHPTYPLRNSSHQIDNTSISGIFPIMTTTIVDSMVMQNLFVVPFSYGMSGFDTTSTLTESNLYNIDLGMGSSKNTLQGSLWGTTALFNVFPFGGFHIPPPSPLLKGASQQLYRPIVGSNLSSGGIQMLQPSMNTVGSMSFSFFGSFGNNGFSSLSF
jgi:hypothetical protein